MSTGRKQVEYWQNFVKSNWGVIRRSGPTLGKERTYQNAAVTQEFKKIDAERKRRRLVVLDQKKQSRKLLMENQIRLLDKSEMVQNDLMNSNQLTQEEKDKALHILDNLENKQNMLKMKEMSYMISLDSFREYKEILRQQETGLEAIADRNKIVKMDKKDLELSLDEISGDLKDIQSELTHYQKLEVNSSELESTHVVLEGTDKLIIDCQITYYETKSQMGYGVTVHPDSAKTLETVKYAIDHNLPIKKEQLYELAPHMFTYEMGELDEVKRKQIEDRAVKLVAIPGGYTNFFNKGDLKKELKSKYTLEDDKQIIRNRDEEGHFYELMENKAQDLYWEYEDYFLAKFEDGFLEYEDIIAAAEDKDPILRTELEQNLIRDVWTIRRMQDDFEDLVKLNQIKLNKARWKLQQPEFITRHPVLLAHFEKVHEHNLLNSIDISEHYCMPNSPEELGIENTSHNIQNTIDKYRKNDIEKMIADSHEEYNKLSFSGDPILEDRDEKDPRQLKKVNMMGDVLHIIEDNEKDKLRLEKQKFPKLFGGDLYPFKPEESKILLKELTKVLWLNNRDPLKYDVKFWALYFNIKPQKLKNVFNFVSFPIVEDGEIVRILRFINLE